MTLSLLQVKEVIWWSLNTLETLTELHYLSGFHWGKWGNFVSSTDKRLLSCPRSLFSGKWFALTLRFMLLFTDRFLAHFIDSPFSRTAGMYYIPERDTPNGIKKSTAALQWTYMHRALLPPGAPLNSVGLCRGAGTCPGCAETRLCINPSVPHDWDMLNGCYLTVILATLCWHSHGFRLIHQLQPLLLHCCPISTHTPSATCCGFLLSLAGRRQMAPDWHQS